MKPIRNKRKKPIRKVKRPGDHFPGGPKIDVVDARKTYVNARDEVLPKLEEAVASGMLMVAVFRVNPQTNKIDVWRLTRDFPTSAFKGSLEALKKNLEEEAKRATKAMKEDLGE